MNLELGHLLSCVCITIRGTDARSFGGAVLFTERRAEKVHDDIISGNRFCSGDVYVSAVTHVQ